MMYAIIPVAIFLLCIGALLILQALYPRLCSDLAFILDKVRMARHLQACARREIPSTIVDELEGHARSTPDKTFLVYRDVRFTYGEVNRRANQLAHAAHHRGVKQGDTVALLIHNEPAFIWTLLAFAKLGVTCALLNYNLKPSSLLHCFEASQAKLLVFGPGDILLKAVVDMKGEMKFDKVCIWSLEKPAEKLEGVQSIEQIIETNVELKQCDMEANFSREIRRGQHFRDPFVYIYTSGTTGLPKASRMSHYKMMAGGHLLNCVNMTSDDVMYVTLPLYHISALLFGLSNVVRNGASMVLRSKFSATHFWTDCCKHDVTIIMYIGELFRYLLARPKTPEEKLNKVRVAVGNGLGGDIWGEVMQRYNISRVLETYGATEANFGIMNVDNKIGSVGCWPPMLRIFCPIELVKYDYESAQPIRDENGRCIKVPPGDIGLLLCPVNKTFPLEGYVGEEDLMRRKLVRNVLREGDVYFNTGDLFVQDEHYNLYFKDRLGDTFRWKGENVATTEVAQMLQQHEDIFEANVYGVAVPGHYGKAGMAALLLSPSTTFDPVATFNFVRSRLPDYACPRFLRLPSTLEHTSTFKQTKFRLVQESFDPKLVKDPLFFFDTARKEYTRLDGPAYLKIVNGDVRI
ncbi:very long-chain acyl-CoA synthetase-like [Acanthaster planci]|uniref:long-chain-fatty-acid--CoA ligase n=1 Tax=Acanthaster planci TaxID=133434 RepID=A0A8B7ZUY8_ACAPL|nr:very long-chain acyl-CoA synthetase-like [Acanthaster planci]XP_022108908.1 very long-chain acyl-CoA synthetase-like [Acanthaster planci]